MEKRDLTRKALSEKLGISASAVVNWGIWQEFYKYEYIAYTL